jgi:hypothetical protein
MERQHLIMFIEYRTRWICLEQGDAQQLRV